MMFSPCALRSSAAPEGDRNLPMEPRHDLPSRLRSSVTPKDNRHAFAPLITPYPLTLRS